MWLWLKNNWISILAVIGVVFLLIYGYQMMNSLFNNDTSLTEKLEKQEQRHVKELADLNKISNEQLTKQNELNQQFTERMDELRTEFQDGLDEIKKSQRRRQTVLSNDPTELGNVITGVFGISSGR